MTQGVRLSPGVPCLSADGSVVPGPRTIWQVSFCSNGILKQMPFQPFNRVPNYANVPDNASGGGDLSFSAATVTRPDLLDGSCLFTEFGLAEDKDPRGERW
jgi:hypothetical protein